LLVQVGKHGRQIRSNDYWAKAGLARGIQGTESLWLGSRLSVVCGSLP
jgi:hypothetical protein